MPEQFGRVETWRVGAPLRVEGVTVRAIERVVRLSGSGRAGAWLSLSLQPCALVVRDAAQARVVAIGDSDVSLPQLREKIPSLDAILVSDSRDQEDRG